MNTRNSGLRPLVLAGLSALALPASAAGAADLKVGSWTRLPEVELRLLAAPHAGGGFRGAIEIRMVEGFKTYWRVPGDSGVPPVFDFSKSAGLGPVAVRFPFPTRFDDGAGGTAWGYKHRVLLPISAETPLVSPLRLRLDFAVCGTMCLPVAADLALDPATAEAAPAELVAELAVTERALPRPLPPDAAIAAAREGAAPGNPRMQRFRLVLPDPGGSGALDAFGEAKGFVETVAIQPGETGRIVAVVSVDPDPGAEGRFGTLRLTYGRPGSAFEATLDLDALPAQP